MILYILNYNNYYNRILKKEDTIEAYLEDKLVYEAQNINFNPNDNIYTEIVVGQGDYAGQGDYVLIVNEYSEIVSRWFILEAIRKRNGQYALQLYRDTLADYYEEILDAPAFIEKANLNAEDPLLFNNEDMTFNQIKKEEIPLKDKSNCPWIVGYYAKNTSEDFLSGTIPLNPLNDVYDILIDSTFENWKYNATTTPIKANINALDYYIYGTRIRPGYRYSDGIIRISANGNSLGMETKGRENYSLNFLRDSVEEDIAKKIKLNKTELYNQALNYTSTFLSNEEREEFLNLNGKIIKDINGKYYNISLYQSELIFETASVAAGSLFNSLSSIVNSIEDIEGIPNTNSFKLKISFLTYKMIAEEIKGLETTWNMQSAKLSTTDAPYNIFAIPFGDCYLHDKSLLTTLAKGNKEYALPLADSIIRTMASNLYDIQLLPYCPINDLREGIVDVRSAEAYSLVKDKDDNVLTYILNVPSASFSRNIPFLKEAPESAIETKIQNECDKYRIASPNFNGYFDFASAKNGGIEFFNVDVTLKPFQPYIHLNPNFGNLYGKDFNDPRGLICGGDFSLSQYLEQWQQYQIQNKNFQEIFDRQIQNIEFNNKYQKQKDVINAITGTISGGVSGAATGLVASGGNPYAAIAGAAIGTVASGAGGIADVNINQKLRNEALDYTKDLFGYQLGNIQALPYTLTKVSSFNDNNKIFPILEYYTCTDREKSLLLKKLAYNGMTVMAIGQLRDYIYNTWTTIDNYTGEEIESKGYIKAQLIRIDGINEDFHIANQIASELNKGVYIK